MTTSNILSQLGSPGVSTGFKNRIINGAMVIDQRNAGASVTITSTSALTYTLDRWAVFGSVASKFSIQQNAGSITAPVGFTNYLGATSLSAYSVGSTEAFQIQQNIEGYNIADLGFGTANAKTVTLSFWVYSSLTGTFGASLQNGAVSRSYPFTYTISSANTWTQISVTIAGDTSGTWTTTNASALTVKFSLGVGSTYNGTANAWATGDYRSVSGAVSVVGTSGATFYITGVQLEVGTNATNFDYRPYGTELALCQRYCQIVAAGTFGTKQSNDASYWYGMYYPKVSFRVKPTSATATAPIKLDYPGTANYTQSSANAAIATYSSTEAVALQCANFTSLIAFSNLVLRDDGGVIQLSAEL